MLKYQERDRPSALSRLRIRVATLARAWESHRLATVATPKSKFDKGLERFQAQISSTEMGNP